MDKRFHVAGLTPFTPLAEAAPALLRFKAEPFFALEEAARSGADADAVHDMRVASRRLREAMRLLEPLYPGRDFRAWYKQVRRVTRALGPVRDSDVFIDYFGRLGGRLGDGGKRAVAFIVGYRAGQRVHELATLNRELAALDLERSRREFDSMSHAVARTAAATMPFGSFAHAAVAERAAAVFGAQPAALVEENIAQQHALRIDYKRLRYAVEAFASCYGEAFGELHTVLTAFQDALGDLHDVHVFLKVLRAPERVAAAGQAGVSAADSAELEALLELRAAEAFQQFAQLAIEHPAEVLLPPLLLPLARLPEPEVAQPEGDAVVGHADISPEDAAFDAADATALEPELEDLAVVSPVVVGDEPWAAAWDAGEAVVEISEDAPGGATDE